jgi:hypothetical protein
MPAFLTASISGFPRAGTSWAIENDPPAISVVGDGPIVKATTPISSTEDLVFIGATLDKQIEADAFSQKILDPLLFPKGKYSDPF